MNQDDILAFRIPLFFSRSNRTTEDNRTGDWAYVQPFYRDRTAPCSEACPCGTDIPRVETLAAQGQYQEAWQTILMENPLPGVCGRVCYHPCERACNRGSFDAPVAVHVLERSLAEQAARNEAAHGLVPRAGSGKRVAILGSGPAGLAAAWFLARLGHACEIFEREPEPGGVLRWGIPAYRLPRPVLAREIQAIQDLGVPIHCGTAGDASLAERFDAVLVACGFGQAMGLGVPGAELARDGLELLHQVRAGRAGQPGAPGARVAVIGGGNTAIDVARTLLRQGQRPVLVYRRRREDMPAFAPEVERALAEGVELMELQAPAGLARDGAGITLALRKMVSTGPGADGRRGVAPAPEPPTALTVAEVYAAVGSEAAPEWRKRLQDGPGQRFGRTTMVFRPRPAAFIGDLGTGPRDPKNVTEAIGSAKEAALALDLLFRSGEAAVAPGLEACRVGGGPSLSMEIYLGGPRARRDRQVVQYGELNTAYFRQRARAQAPVLAPAASLGSFDEVEGGLDPAEAAREAERCFSCGTCNECDNCRTFCPDVAVRLDGLGRRIETNYCKGCGVCVTECPRSAMAMSMEEGRP
jgi:NADPH-dependent glutamate synthase beta subunit-like oxidoreductase